MSLSPRIELYNFIFIPTLFSRRKSLRHSRVQREVLGITIYSHHDLEVALRRFNAAYNARRQRVLNGLSPEMVLRQRLEAEPTLVNSGYNPPKPGILQAALSVVAEAKEVSHPETW